MDLICDAMNLTHIKEHSFHNKLDKKAKAASALRDNGSIVGLSCEGGCVHILKPNKTFASFYEDQIVLSHTVDQNVYSLYIDGYGTEDVFYQFAVNKETRVKINRHFYYVPSKDSASPTSQKLTHDKFALKDKDGSKLFEVHSPFSEQNESTSILCPFLFLKGNAKHVYPYKPFLRNLPLHTLAHGTDKIQTERSEHNSDQNDLLEEAHDMETEERKNTISTYLSNSAEKEYTLFELLKGWTTMDPKGIQKKAACGAITRKLVNQIPGYENLQTGVRMGIKKKGKEEFLVSLIVSDKSMTKAVFQKQRKKYETSPWCQDVKVTRKGFFCHKAKVLHSTPSSTKGLLRKELNQEWLFSNQTD